jgi:hypothetical protein
MERDPMVRLQRGEYFSVVVKKAGPSKISGVSIVFAGLKRQFHYGGTFGSGSLHSEGPNLLPSSRSEITAVAVSWRTVDGAIHKQSIDLTPDLRPRPRDNMVFLFRDGDSVTLQRFSESELDQAMKKEW